MCKLPQQAVMDSVPDFTALIKLIHCINDLSI